MAFTSSELLGEWEPVHYEDRDPRRGKRANRYHAMKLFPNYSQFSSHGQGVTFSDTKGREYRIADGVDRLEYIDSGIITAGNPYTVEPTIYYDSTMDKNVVTFMEGLYGDGELFSTPPVEGKDRVSDYTRVQRGAQLLYVRIPIPERRRKPDLSLPDVGEILQLVHLPTGALATGSVGEVDGHQFKDPSTGSVFLNMLTFIIPPLGS